MTSIAHSKPWITSADMQAVMAVLESGMVGQWETTRAFEGQIAKWVGALDGVAVGSGAAALSLALSALGIGAGHDVVLPTYVCRSVLDAVITADAKPVMADVGANWVITPECVARVVTNRTRAIIVPHLYGIAASTAEFQVFGIPIIEDFAQRLPPESVTCLVSDIGLFSFHPTKVITTGEGGVAVSRNPSLASKMRERRDGRIEAPSRRLFSPLSDCAAALGLSQLSRYEEMLERRRHLAKSYRDALLPVAPQVLPASQLETTNFRFPIRVRGGLDSVQGHYSDREICVRRGVDQLMHRLVGESDSNFPQSVALFDSTVSLPIYPALTDDEASRVIETTVDLFYKLTAESR